MNVTVIHCKYVKSNLNLDTENIFKIRHRKHELNKIIFFSVYRSKICFKDPHYIMLLSINCLNTSSMKYFHELITLNLTKMWFFYGFFPETLTLENAVLVLKSEIIVDNFFLPPLKRFWFYLGFKQLLIFGIGMKIKVSKNVCVSKWLLKLWIGLIIFVGFE